jgi:hypothetical protein
VQVEFQECEVERGGVGMCLVRYVEAACDAGKLIQMCDCSEVGNRSLYIT